MTTRTTDNEMRDVPMFHNDMTDSIPTMDKPLDTLDAPGRADSELGLDAWEQELLLQTFASSS
jgi:hypothetical protein